MNDIKTHVRERYGQIAAAEGSCCDPTSCCSGSDRLGYDRAALESIPAEANLGLGCGNPLSVAALQPGETVLDLGSGPGLDCFLAARAVGAGGRVIGVDMTAEMISRARDLVEREGATNIDIRLGEIEHLPVADGSVNVVMSNCVINLSPDKPAVYREAFRVLKPGGRIAIMDIVAVTAVPDAVRDDMDQYCACIGGAATIEQTERWLAEAGFEQIRIEPQSAWRELISAGILAEKPS